MVGKVKTALQVVLTLALVGAVYSSTWILAATGAASPRAVMEFVEVDDDRFAEVVWIPAAPPAPDPAPEASSSAGPATANTNSAAEGIPSVEAPKNYVAANAGPANPKVSTLRAIKRVRRGKRVRKAAPKRELTKKQTRVRKRRKRRRERLAKQPQCDELIDQIVPVSDGEWWVGQDLAGCYRAHPRQFTRMGGMQWVEDDNDKRVGLRLYLSTKERGDIARAVGFRRGDVLRSLNGVPLRSTVGSSFAVAQLVTGRAKLKFLRDGEEHRVVLRVVGEGKLEKARARARVVAELAADSGSLIR